MLPGESGTELMQRAASGDAEALEQLLLSHHDRLVAAITRKLPGDMRGQLTADDVAQEAYIVTFRQIREFSPQGSDAFFRWVLKIAEHRLFDMVKARKAAKRGGDRQQVGGGGGSESTVIDVLELLAVNPRTPSRSIASREAVDAIRGALDGLKEEYREALRLRYVEGLPVAEIAQRMNRTEGAIHMLCHRGLKALEEGMGPAANFLTRK